MNRDEKKEIGGNRSNLTGEKLLDEYIHTYEKERGDMFINGKRSVKARKDYQEGQRARKGKKGYRHQGRRILYKKDPSPPKGNKGGNAIGGSEGVSASTTGRNAATGAENIKGNSNIAENNSTRKYKDAETMAEKKAHQRMIDDYKRSHNITNQNSTIEF